MEDTNIKDESGCIVSRDMSKKRVDVLNMPIPKALWKLSIPMMLTFAFQTVYNMVDAYFLGKLGHIQFAATTLVFPVVFTFIALGMGFGMASTALVSQYFGAAQCRKAEKAAAQVMLIMIVIGILVLITGLIFSKPIVYALGGKENAEVLPYALSYFRIVFYGIVFAYLFQVASSTFRGLGDVRFAMELMFFSATLNIILDPILIFGWGPIPGMGVAGAAWATTISRFAIVIMALYVLFRGDRGFKLHISDFVPDWLLIKKAFSIGIPGSIGQMITSFGFVVVMKAVAQFGPVVVSAYGVGNRIISFITMIAVGIGMAVAIMVGQFIGARRYDDAVKTVKIAVISSFLFIGVLSTITFFFGKYVTIFFINDPRVVEVGAEMFKYVSFSIPFFGTMNIFISVLNGAGKSLQATLANVIRLWGVRVPLVFYLSSILGYRGIFIAMLISNIMAMVIAYLFYRFTNWKVGVIHDHKEASV